MKPFVIVAALLVASCAAAPYGGAISTQYQHLDPHSHTYSYGYSDPNSQKHESRSHDGTTHGHYSYLDGHGHLQSVSYKADPHHGFIASGTNLPKAPALPASHYAAAHSYATHAVHAVHDHGHYAHHGPIHHVTLTHAGVPVDTPEVQHAKAAHAAAHAAAAHNAYDHGHGHHLYKRSLYGGHWAHAAPVALTHAGVPVDHPDVQAARAEHFAAHGKALAALGHGHGAPIDTPEVQHAKAAHFAAHAAARSGHAGSSHAHIAHGYHVPVIHNGVPVDTPEVQLAKAAHYAALSEASAHAGYSSHDDGHYDGRWDGHHDGGHYDNSHGYDHGHGYKGPIHIPVIHNGVPVEPAEVQHARSAHLSALASASHNSGYAHHGGWEDDGQYRHGHY